MMCSAMELGLGDDHDGIIDLPADAPVGVKYADCAGLDDAVIDFAVTPNRPDAPGVHGMARDLAAAGLGKLIDRPVQAVRASAPARSRSGSISRRATRSSARPSRCGWCAA